MACLNFLYFSYFKKKKPIGKHDNNNNNTTHLCSTYTKALYTLQCSTQK